jgi:hypothetical protein
MSLIGLIFGQEVGRAAVRMKNGKWLVTVTPPQASGFEASKILLEGDQYWRYLQWLEKNNGILLQEALPELSNAEREILLTGICPSQWDNAFKDDE